MGCAAGLEVMRVMAFHLFSGVTPGVEAGTRVPRVDLNRALAMGIDDGVRAR